MKYSDDEEAVSGTGIEALGDQFKVNSQRVVPVWLFDICFTFCDLYDRSHFLHMKKKCISKDVWQKQWFF